MKKCMKCNVTILDDAEHCPLCHHALSGDDKGVSTYPNAVASIKKARFLENLILLLSLIASISLLLINYFFKTQVWWSVIVILALFYGNLVLRYAILGRSGYRAKIFLMVIVAVIILCLIDYLTGYQGWALSYVYPSILIGVDVSLLIIMIVNRRNWQSYIMMQILVLLASFASFLFVGLGFSHSKLMALIASVFAFFALLGTMILGDKRARNEVKRRFHI